MVCVAPVAGIPDECVVAGTEPRSIVASVAVDRVVAGAAEQCLDSLAAGDRVVSGAAVNRGRNDVGERAVRVVDANGVAAFPGVDGDSRHRRAREAEVRDAVVADVDLENTGITGFQAKRDLVARLVPLIVSTPYLSCGCLNDACG